MNGLSEEWKSCVYLLTSLYKDTTLVPDILCHEKICYLINPDITAVGRDIFNHWGNLEVE